MTSPSSNPTDVFYILLLQFCQGCLTKKSKWLALLWRHFFFFSMQIWQMSDQPRPGSTYSISFEYQPLKKKLRNIPPNIDGPSSSRGPISKPSDLRSSEPVFAVKKQQLAQRDGKIITTIITTIIILILILFFCNLVS